MTPGAAVSGAAVPGDVVPGDVVTGDVVTGDVVTGDVVTGDVVTGDAVTGAAVPGASVPGAVVPGDTVTGDTVTGDAVGVLTAVAMAGPDAADGGADPGGGVIGVWPIWLGVVAGLPGAEPVTAVLFLDGAFGDGRKLATCCGDFNSFETAGAARARDSALASAVNCFNRSSICSVTSAARRLGAPALVRFGSVATLGAPALVRFGSVTA